MSDDVTQDNSEAASDAYFSAQPMQYEAAEIADQAIADDAPASEAVIIDEIQETHPLPIPLWERIRRAILGDIDNVAERIRHLDAAIENAADTPANYVLRGELYLTLREYALARRDFQRAQELAAAQFQQSDWGLMAQAMEDRALIGLQKAERKLKPDGSLS
jgi:tetratricopeptide (TPR) repeat protein